MLKTNYTQHIAYKTPTSSLLQHQHIIIPVYNNCHQVTTDVVNGIFSKWRK